MCLLGGGGGLNQDTSPVRQHFNENFGFIIVVEVMGANVTNGL
jgi:hypothetical protein